MLEHRCFLQRDKNLLYIVTRMISYSDRDELFRCNNVFDILLQIFFIVTLT